MKRIFEVWRDFRQGTFDRPELQKKLEPICRELLAALETGEQSDDKRVRRFCRTLVDLYPARWTFLPVQDVEPTNNPAERTLRLAVIRRKICFGSHSEVGGRFAERILTVVQTLRLQNRNVMAYLEEAFTEARKGNAIPTLLLTGV